MTQHGTKPVGSRRRRPANFACDGDHTGADDKTLRLHYAYGCRDELTRDAVNRRQRDYVAAKRARDPKPKGTEAPSIDSTIPVRKLRALVALGWTPARLTVDLSFTSTETTWWLLLTPPELLRRSTCAAIDQTYKRLRYEDPPRHTTDDRTQAGLARALADSHGWRPPFAYVDIENPKAS